MIIIIINLTSQFSMNDDLSRPPDIEMIGAVFAEEVCYFEWPELGQGESSRLLG